MGKDDDIILVNSKNISDSSVVDLLCAFELDYNKYVVYSKNEYDYEGNVIVYCGKINEKDDGQYIENVFGEEYNRVKDVIKKMVDYNGGEISNV